MGDSVQDTSNKLSESGMHEIQELADPALRARYRHLQWVSISAAVIHAIAVFLAIYDFRAGDLHDFSMVQLMRFIPMHTAVWQCTCLAIGASSVSYLVLFIAFKQVLRVRYTLWTNVATFLIVAGVALDLQTYSNLAIFFSDLSTQLVTSTGFPKHLLLLEGWRTLNQALAQSMIVANSLYSLAGLALCGAIISGYGLPKWLGWTSIPIWLVALVASALTFMTQISWVVVLMFAVIIAFILWTIATAVSVDAYAHTHKIRISPPEK